MTPHFSRLLFTICLLLGALSWTTGVGLHAQSITSDASSTAASSKLIEQASTRITDWEAQLKNLRTRATSQKIGTDRLRDIVTEQRTLLIDILALKNDLEPIRADTKARLDRLGPAPTDSSIAEAPGLAEQRQSIGAAFALYDGLVRKLGVQAVEARQIGELANATLRRRFARRLLKPVPEIYTGQFWRTAIISIGVQNSVAVSHLANWKKQLSEGSAWRFVVLLFLPLLIGMLASSGLFSLFRKSSIGRLHDAEDITISARGTRAISGALVGALPIAVGLASLYLLARETGLLQPNGGAIVLQLLVITSVAIFYWLLVKRTFAPKNADFRLFTHISDSASRALAWLLLLLVVVWYVDWLLKLMDAAFYAPRELTAMREAVFAIVCGGIILAMLAVPLRDADLKRNGWPKWLFVCLAGLAGFIFLTTLLGFVSLADFAGSQLIGTGGVLLAMYLVHNAADYVSSREAINFISRSGSAGNAQKTDSGSGMTRMTASLVLDLVMLVVGIPALLLQWGFDWVEVQGWISTAFYGFQIGGLTISIQSIAIAVAIVVVGLAVTRLVQRWFVHRSSVSQRANSGVRDSIEIILGYIGILVSGAFAISYLGIDFTNLAIVAGALSVGIGFGLQNIVSNFISGLILLAERPIKAGDWIVVGTKEGIVQRVSVRATEIRTFDRSSVLIPNSELIAGEVTNWTLGSTLARVVVNVGVAYDSNPKHVMQVLDEIGRAHPLCLEHPSPQLVFEDFSDSAMNFSLRIFISDVGSGMQTRTDLRTAIWTRFKEEGLEIPFPQRDLNIRHVAKKEDETVEDFLFGGEKGVA